MTTLFRTFAVVLMVLLALVGCKPSVEGETKAWADNVKKVEALQATYPGFKKALAARIESATKEHEKAADLADEAKAEQLRAANSALMGGFVGDLTDVEKELEKLRKQRVEATAKAGDAASQQAAKVAAEDAGNAMKRVEKLLETGAQDEAAAKAVLDKAKKDLKIAADALATVTKVDKDKKDAKDAEKKATDDKAAADKAAADAKVADWKCAYCDAMNKHDATQCASCGAPRGK